MTAYWQRAVCQPGVLLLPQEGMSLDSHLTSHFFLELLQVSLDLQKWTWLLLEWKFLQVMPFLLLSQQLQSSGFDQFNEIVYWLLLRCRAVVLNLDSL